MKDYYKIYSFSHGCTHRVRVLVPPDYNGRKSVGEDYQFKLDKEEALKIFTHHCNHYYRNYISTQYVLVAFLGASHNRGNIVAIFNDGEVLDLEKC